MLLKTFEDGLNYFRNQVSLILRLLFITNSRVVDGFPVPIG